MSIMPFWVNRYVRIHTRWLPVPSYWTLISVYVCQSMESTFPTVFWTTRLIITFCMFIHPQCAIQMNASASCNHAWRIFMAQLRANCVRNVLVCLLTLISFLVNQRLDLRQILYCFWSTHCFLCMESGLWTSVFCSVWKENDMFLLCWFYCFCLQWDICSNYIKLIYI